MSILHQYIIVIDQLIYRFNHMKMIINEIIESKYL